MTAAEGGIAALAMSAVELARETASQTTPVLSLSELGPVPAIGPGVARAAGLGRAAGGGGGAWEEGSRLV